MRFWTFSGMFYGDTLEVGVRIIGFGNLEIKGTLSEDIRIGK